ncbi:hypothetical protein [Desulfitobacterium sp.]|uniref:hypothetical protein n=1 Tax=Desulfitobacterium sp. TaxID=49981 RepID=UPI002D02456A|nr:hypothetical protein [Desulfitobacterium sp.]HVJ50523.1 hypothetical protein [Desulfitobacterium sp.]
MEKLMRVLALVVLGTLLLSNVALATQTTQATSDEQSIQSRYTQNELNQIREIKNEVVKQGAVTLNTDGTITVNANAATLGVDENIFKEYIQRIYSKRGKYKRHSKIRGSIFR